MLNIIITILLLPFTPFPNDRDYFERRRRKGNVVKPKQSLSVSSLALHLVFISLAVFLQHTGTVRF